jgi:hypothetical protein
MVMSTWESGIFSVEIFKRPPTSVTGAIAASAHSEKVRRL